jgi:hypothetical protein
MTLLIKSDGNIMSNETKHIFILVAGTVDPVCLTVNSVKPATNQDGPVIITGN